MACITSINISARKGVRKTPVGDAPQVVLVDDGLENDAHAGKWHRQVSFLAEASLAKARDMGLEVGPGDFAENFTTEGIDLLDLPLGTQLRLGKDVLVEISQITEKFYIQLMTRWTRELQTTLEGSDCTLLLGVPAYEDVDSGYHHPRVENLASALAGIQAAKPGGNYIGCAIYCEWEMTPEKWQIWRSNFLKQPY